MSKKHFKNKNNSLIEITRKYANDEAACIQFFMDIKWPTGFYCEKCGCTHHYKITKGKILECKDCGHHHYLFAGTIFQDNKLDMYKLIVGIYLFFSANKGYTAIQMASDLDVNYDTACRLCKKCRILMSQSNGNKILDSMYYESDVTYIGSTSENKPGMATDKQAFLVVLSTDKENQYPRFIKLCPIPVDKGDYIKTFITKKVELSKDRVLNTDGKTTYKAISEQITWRGEKIVYTETNHRLYWLNVIWGNIKNNILGIYHGVSKRELPLFAQEQEWRFNHRNTGLELLNKIKKYILQSSPMIDSVVSHILDISKPTFTKPTSEG